MVEDEQTKYSRSVNVVIFISCEASGGNLGASGNVVDLEFYWR